MKSIYIILEQFKKDNLSEEETVNLIEDLYNKNHIYSPIFTRWPQITYTEPKFQKWEVTCDI